LDDDGGRDHLPDTHPQVKRGQRILEKLNEVIRDEKKTNCRHMEFGLNVIRNDGLYTSFP
jgi:hypothetical protein